MIVTTAGRTNEEMIEIAKRVAGELGVSYIAREKRSIPFIQQDSNQDVLVVGKNRLEIYPIKAEEPIFFHPNSAMFRMKRVMRGEDDPFLQAAILSNGDSVLDCTLGLGSDSILASYVTGKAGRVTALEGNKYLYYLLKAGLQSWDTGISEMNEAMKRIEVKHDTFERFLETCPAESFDIVYFDPMFEESIDESNGIKGLRTYAMYSKLNTEIIVNAKRVAKKRVVLKDHWKSEQFEKFGFSVIKRKTSKFHFGVIDV